MPNPLDTIQGQATRIIATAQAKATEIPEAVGKVASKLIPEVKLGTAYGCWSIAGQGQCLHNPFFIYPAAIGAICVAASTILNGFALKQSERTMSRSSIALIAPSVVLRVLGCAFYSVCFAFALGSLNLVAKPLQSQSGGDLGKGLAYRGFIGNFLLSLIVLALECYYYKIQLRAR